MRIAGDALAAVISPVGAELRSITDADGREWLWDGDPAWWAGRAPILFPVIGVVRGGVIRIDGTAYPMPKHGIARRSTFRIAAKDDASVTLRLEANEETRAAYPFAFTLDIRFVIEGPTLAVIATVMNRDTVPLPASFGFHPALRWPLPGAGARADHVVRFAEPEPAPLRRIDALGLLTPEPHPSPIVGDTLHPADAMFEDDALIFDAAVSRSLWFGVAGHPGVRLEREGLPMLGIWTKPGAPYLCLEPWQGIADPQGFTGDFREKPGVVEIAPEGERMFAMRLTIGVPG